MSIALVIGFESSGTAAKLDRFVWLEEFHIINITGCVCDVGYCSLLRDVTAVSDQKVVWSLTADTTSAVTLETGYSENHRRNMGVSLKMNGKLCVSAAVL